MRRGNSSEGSNPSLSATSLPPLSPDPGRPRPPSVFDRALGVAISVATTMAATATSDGPEVIRDTRPIGTTLDDSAADPSR